MAVTKSWEIRIVSEADAAREAVKSARRRDLPWMLAASLLVLPALALVYFAKTQSYSDVSERLRAGELLNINTVGGAAPLLPFLEVIEDRDARDAAARQIADYVAAHRPLRNVGSLARLRQLGTRRALLPLSRLKPLFVVRTPREFTMEFIGWCALYFAAFYGVWALWRWRRFEGDAAVLPALHLLTGMGLVLMTSLRDPLRDTLEFSKFAWGVAAGCLFLLLPLFRFIRYERLAKWCYTPLLAAFGLFALLLRFGSGPTGNDSKVNLGPFQPVEAIKILIVLFLAGYFARKWERLRDLREKRLVPASLRWLGVPRLSHVLPVLIAVVSALALFFILKDLGPALVIGFLFMAMFAVARGRPGLAILGIALLIGGVWAGYALHKPPTVVDRISMWLSPWDNNVRGGDQLAHALWAFSTGGPWGSGPGWGDPGMIPAGHTDLVLPALGEEWGFAGTATVFLLFAFLLGHGLKIALRAADEYGLFLAVGLSSLIAFEMLLISGGVLGAIPLSGVVSPFLSSGNTAMLANFLIFGLLLSISQRQHHNEIAAPFRASVRGLGWALASGGVVLLGFAADYQVAHDRDYLARDTHVFESDGVKRPQHNPRLNSLAHEIQRGNIYDRNGVLLATSSWRDLERQRPQLEALGVSLDTCCSRLDGRHYPFGNASAHLLGDLRTQENFHATNASPIEHDANGKLQGFRDYNELAELIRYRHQPGNPRIVALKGRDRDVRASIDIKLQLKAEGILRDALQHAHKDKGALVVLDPRNGDTLALVSIPEPATQAGGGAGAVRASPDELLDRARYGQYPPGSTFKLVTAMAALKKDGGLERQAYVCQRLPDGRAGTLIPGWRRLIKDDIGDHAHGRLTMERAIQVSCNAYFAQLGVYAVGAQSLKGMTDALEIPAGTLADIRHMLPFASYGQGTVVTSPFKMARVAATIAAGGLLPQGRWVIDSSNTRTLAPRPLLDGSSAAFLAHAMRDVVTGGTGRRAFAGLDIPVAGKTGTAQMDEGLPHSWFAGFAPYSAETPPAIAFAIVVEHGGYGGDVAAPIGRKLVMAARETGILH